MFVVKSCNVICTYSVLQYLRASCVAGMPQGNLRHLAVIWAAFWAFSRTFNRQLVEQHHSSFNKLSTRQKTFWTPEGADNTPIGRSFQPSLLFYLHNYSA